MNPHCCLCAHRFTSTALLLVTLASHKAIAQTTTDSWKFMVGLGAINQPKYPGSKESRTSVLPVISAGYGHYFIGGVPGTGIPAGLGVFFIRNDHWQVGAGIGANLEKPRKESDSARLHGLGDIDPTVLGAFFASYTNSWFVVRDGFITDIGGNGHGTEVSMDLEAKYSPIDKLILSAGPGATWADDQYQQTFFGIDTVQSAHSGQAPYEAKNGINAWRFTVGVNYLVTPKWSLGGRIIAARLSGDAANSPIAESKSQNSISAFTTYRF